MCKIFVCILIFTVSSAIAKHPNIHVTSSAISSLISHFCDVHYVHNFTVYYEKDEYLERLADKVLKKSSSPLSVMKVDTSEGFKSTFKAAQVLLLRYKNQTIQFVKENSDPYSTQKNVKILYYMDSMDIYTLREKLVNVKTPFLFYLLHNPSDDSMMLYNTMYYIPGYCQNFERTWHIVNIFNYTNLEWIAPYFLQKMDYYFECPIVIFFFIDDENEKFNIVRNKSGVAVSYGGYYVDLVNIFGQKYGIKLDKMVAENGCRYLDSICIPNHGSRANPFYSYTIQTSSEYMTFTVPRGSQYTPFEKLLLPFDLATWIMILITFFIAYLTILIIYLCPIFVQKFVFGRDNRDPSLCLAQIFFGIGLIQTPGRNFARFLFVSFSIYCLIIRTAYQGKMFDFLHSKAEKPTLETMQDLIDHQIPVYYVKDNSVGVLDTKVLLSQHDEGDKLNLVAITNEEYMDIAHNGKENGEIYALVVTRHEFNRWQKYNGYKNRWENWKNMKIFKDDYIFGISPWFVQSDHIMYDQLCKFVLEIHQHGILARFEKLNYVNQAPKEDEPLEILTMYMLSAGFIVWLASVLIACLSFIGEHIYRYLTFTRHLKSNSEIIIEAEEDEDIFGIKTRIEIAYEDDMILEDIEFYEDAYEGIEVDYNYDIQDIIENLDE